MMKVVSVLFIALLGVFTTARADEQGMVQAKAFEKIYSLCVKHLHNPDGLRKKLSTLPSLPPEKAKTFLHGRAGKAYPVPDKSGLFVLTLVDDLKLCGVYARRIDTETAKADFKTNFSSAPAPIIVEKMPTTTRNTKNNGKTETLSYKWRVKGRALATLAMLTVAPKKDADLQAIFTVSFIGNSQ